MGLDTRQTVQDRGNNYRLLLQKAIFKVSMLPILLKDLKLNSIVNRVGCRIWNPAISLTVKSLGPRYESWK